MGDHIKLWAVRYSRSQIKLVAVLSCGLIFFTETYIFACMSCDACHMICDIVGG